MYSRRQKRRDFYVVPSHRTPKYSHALPSHGNGYMSGEGIFHKRNNVDLRTAIREHLIAEKAKRAGPLSKLKDKIKVKKGEGLNLHSRNRQITTLLRKHGDDIISHFVICRAPIKKRNKKLINLLTAGKLSEIQKDMNYDEVFHLYLEITLSNGKRFMIEKNSVVDVAYKKVPRENVKALHVPAKGKHSVYEMITKAEKFNKNLYRYTSDSYNCQNFILSLMKPIGNWNEKLNKFVYQDYSDLYTPVTSAISQGITDASALFHRLIGNGLHTTGNGLHTTGNGLHTTGNGLTTTGSHSGDGLMLTGQRKIDILKPHIPKVPTPIEKKDPLKKLRGRVKPIKPVIKKLVKKRVEKRIKKIKGEGMPGRKDIEKFLRDNLKEELQGHVDLTKAHLNRILKHFKLHPDNNSLVKHAIHLSHQLVKHYYKSPKKKGKGQKRPYISSHPMPEKTLYDKLAEKLFKLIFKAITAGVKKGSGQSGEGLKKKTKKIFKDIGHFLKKHRKDIAKGVSYGSKIAETLAVAMGQPELVAPLKLLEKAGDLGQKNFKSPDEFLDTVVSEITG